MLRNRFTPILSGLLFAFALSVGCLAEGPATDGGTSKRDAGEQDGGIDPCSDVAPSGSGADAGNDSTDPEDRTDPEEGEGGGEIDLDGGQPLPPGRFRCYFGTNYNCNAEGQDCCELNDLCYFPATEPEFCREDECP